MRHPVLGLVLFLALSAVCGVAEAQQCTLTNVTESLPGFFLDEPVNFQIDVCCGTAPYKFEILEGSLPEGLHLNASGRITGKPRAEGETIALILISDSAGCSLGVTYPVLVVAGEP